MTEEEVEYVHSKFKLTFKGMIENSGGWKALLGTKYNYISIILFTVLIVIYLVNVHTVEHSLKMLSSIDDAALGLLGGIVGLSLAGLTLIITFGNPEMILRGAELQYKDFSEKKEINPTYFQIAISKFAFIVFFQVIVLLEFFISKTVTTMDIKISNCMAYLINSCVFAIELYSLIYALLLVIALIVNLFSFSQQSNEHHFGSAYKKSNNSKKCTSKDL